MDNADSYKDTFRVWCEYLLESDAYRELCEQSPPTTLIFGGENFEFSELAKQADYYTYLFWGDIHSPSFTFEELWNKNKSEIDFKIAQKISNREGKSNHVFNYSERAAYEIECCILDFKRKNKREPELHELKSCFPNFIEQRSNSYLGPTKRYLILRVDLIESDRGELIKDFRKMLREQFNTPEVKAGKILERNTSDFPTRLLKEKEIKTLRRYLHVYKMRKNKKSYRDVMLSLLTPEEKREYDSADISGKKAMFEDRRPNLIRDNRLAKKYIKNAEKGNFPGDKEK